LLDVRIRLLKTASTRGYLTRVAVKDHSLTSVYEQESLLRAHRLLYQDEAVVFCVWANAFTRSATMQNERSGTLYFMTNAQISHIAHTFPYAIAFITIVPAR